MLRSYYPPRKLNPVADLIILVGLSAAIYGLVAFGREWQADFQPNTPIDLSLGALPIYSIFSTLRAAAAYLLSLLFTLVVGYVAAKSRGAERIILPLLDILQSIPVLGFLPGLVLGLIAIFPRSNTGLEAAAIIMIFTGQVWNMTFSYYSSLKSVPGDLVEAASVMGMSWWKRLGRLELPFAAVNLAWNSLMSMAGGWFFLTVCEAFTLGDREYRLPGLGAYMATAIEKGDTKAMVFGVAAMTLVIVLMDFFLWRPVLAWVHRFRLEDVPGVKPGEPMVQLVLKQALVYEWGLKFSRLLSVRARRLSHKLGFRKLYLVSLDEAQRVATRWFDSAIAKVLLVAVAVAGLAFLGSKAWKFVLLLKSVSFSTWTLVARNTLWTFLRVLCTLGLSTVWAVPVGIWIGLSPTRVRVAQPIIQVLASFPAPMLYPLALGVLFKISLPFSISSMFLMMLGVQWYVLFNVLAGALRIPQELQSAASLMGLSPVVRWSKLYLPSVFPALVTGWVTAAGGAWNSSIVAEYVSYRGGIVSANGLGATISAAAAKADFQVLAAALSFMVVTVILLNRTFWARIYTIAQTRYRMDL